MNKLTIFTLLLLVSVGLSGFTANKDGSLVMSKEEVTELRKSVAELQRDNVGLAFQNAQLIRELKAEKSKACI